MKIIEFLKAKFQALQVHILTLRPKKLADYLFYKTFDKTIDWENPRDLNEWINKLMHTTDTTQWSILADKYAVRAYVYEKGLGEILVPLFGMWYSAKHIDATKLPHSFVLKANNGCESVLIVRGGGMC